MIRWGIIGCGDVTEVKSGPGFQKAEGSALRAVMRRDANRAADYARRHGVPKWYDDTDQLINDGEVDAVYIATPPGSHEELAMKVAARGKPCYVEKPMSRNANEARRMVEEFGRLGIPLFVAYYRRAQPRFLKIKEILESGRLGKLKSVTYVMATDQMINTPDPIPWRYQPEVSGGGLVLDVGSHVLDLLDFFLGPLQNVRGHAHRNARGFPVEDHVEMNFSAGQIDGQARWDFAAKTAADEFRFSGTNEELRFSCFGIEPLAILTHDGEERIATVQPMHVAQPLIQAVVDDILGRGRKCPSTGVSALRTQVILDTILSDFYGGREDGFWKRSR